MYIPLKTLNPCSKCKRTPKIETKYHKGKALSIIFCPNPNCKNESANTAYEFSSRVWQMFNPRDREK